MRKILIIGKRGFIGNNLSSYLKKFFKVSYKRFKDLNKNSLKTQDFDYIINTSINKLSKVFNYF